jgi:hypothetical protein
MNINKALAKWRKTKDISLASDICSALIEMLEDDKSVAVHRQAENCKVEIAFESVKHQFLLVKIDEMCGFERRSVLEDKDER